MPLYPPAGGSGGAPTDAVYIVGSADGTLSAERVVTDTATITWDQGTAAQLKANVVNPRIVVLADDQGVIDSITGEECAGIQATATGTGTFYYRYVLRYQCSVSTVGIKFGINHTGTATHAGWWYMPGAAGAADQTVTTPPVAVSASATRAFSTTAPDLGPSVSVDTINVTMLAVIEGHLIVTADGDLELWFACETLTGDGTVTIKAKSCLILHKVAT